MHDVLKNLKGRKERAHNRLNDLKEDTWCFGIIGLECDFEEITISNLAKLRAVTEPPGEIELAGACQDPGIFGSVARYSRRITHELAIQKSTEDPNISFLYAWCVMSVLRIKSNADLLVPVAANYSWSVISALPSNSCIIQFLEDVPKAYRFQRDIEIEIVDIEWVRKHIDSFQDLTHEARFMHAITAFNEHPHHANVRMSCVSLWSGIESIFSIDAELRFRISAYVAAYLRERGNGRLNLYKRMKKLYDLRSKAVHGGKLSDDDIADHVKEVREILAECLVKIVQNGSIPSQDVLDGFLFS
jgi:hypothetical protein